MLDAFPVLDLDKLIGITALPCHDGQKRCEDESNLPCQLYIPIYGDWKQCCDDSLVRVSDCYQESTREGLGDERIIASSRAFARGDY